MLGEKIEFYGEQLSILAISIYEIKKHVISKMYNYLERR